MIATVQDSWVALDEFKFIELSWFQPSSFKRVYELKFDDEQLGRLEFKSFYSTAATGEMAGGIWTMKKTGTFSPIITIRNKGSKVNLAQIDCNSCGKSTAKFQTGEAFQLKYVDMWKGILGWYDGDKLIAEFRMMMSFNKKLMNITYFTKDIPKKTMSMLILLGTYHYINAYSGM